MKLITQLKKHKDSYLQSPMPSKQERIKRLQSLKVALLEHQDELCAALNNDFGQRSSTESQLLDILPTINYINYSCKKLKGWMKSEKRHSGLLLGGAKVKVMYQPLGVVGIIGSWNAPLTVTLAPLVTAISAGNHAMIKMSEFNPSTNKVVAKIIAQAFDQHLVSMVEGEASVSAEFSQLPFDHLVFTGSTTVGKHVMSAAAKNLTPVTLELGGKCPVIIGEDMDIDDAVSRIVFGKAFNSGQICLAPDYIFCPADKENEFIQAYCKKFQQLFPDFVNNKDHTSIHSDRHFQRFQHLLNDAKQKGATITSANNIEGNAATRLMATHLVSNVSDDMQLMQEEIFGPILPIKTYKNLEEVSSYINNKTSPLGLYIMTFNKKSQQYLLENTHSGGVSINEVLFHAMCDDAPFGGVGESGIGHYHGPEGFKALSKAKTVLTRGKFYPGKWTSPPYNNSLIKPIVKFLLRS
ncbi:coniferyl aldehyde dehydrogenase [Thalassotalea nanhaiensis]|uniref:Aldehyde dehydrogenase n=1 Tax=Thalassotalea nanhaiensis TaxID=3065648 RepID=A0ABY9TD84_9GAMM|nr:coniferyl aldehyde dehydrogenase [Colwelliaceae bacterium SQ345]